MAAMNTNESEAARRKRMSEDLMKVLAEDEDEEWEKYQDEKDQEEPK